MSAPAVSVLCPAFRTEPYLAATLDSVLAQTSPDWELVVVDNGLSDAVARIVEPYLADRRVRFLRQPNRGLDGGFTAAADAAGGRYLIPLATDDLLVPTTVARMTAVLDARPEIAVLACDAFLLDDAGGALRAGSWSRAARGRGRVSVERRIGLADVLGGRDLYYAAAFRREVWSDAGGYRAGDVSDLALWLTVLRRGHDVRMLPERLGVFRLRGDSTSRAPDRRAAFLDRLEGVCAEAAADVPELHRLAGRRVGHARYVDDIARARAAFVAGDVAAARRHAVVALSRRRTPRAGAILAGLTVAPGLLRVAHPLRRRTGAALSTVAARVLRVRERTMAR